jgi:hypothetical protein
LQPPPSEGNDGTSRASTPTLSSHPQTQLPKKAGILSIFDEKLYDEEKVQSAIRKNDVLKKAEQRIDANTWDVEAWLTLVNEARNEGLDVGRWCV